MEIEIKLKVEPEFLLQMLAALKELKEINKPAAAFLPKEERPDNAPKRYVIALNGISDGVEKFFGGSDAQLKAVWVESPSPRVTVYTELSNVQEELRQLKVVLPGYLLNMTIKPAPEWVK